ncbi:DUF4041 domain-containing protein [Buttiauxella sp. W03-F01]|uniref:DUF4041 domain-containing protein n=1 Tax=Buttiauxella sp. S04-F03 TaxID=2904525 RepID=UPI001E57BAFE|nr:DUF4041 domain-containing protein [Buttiauxella sp. S04-F03]
MERYSYFFPAISIIIFVIVFFIFLLLKKTKSLKATKDILSGYESRFRNILDAEKEAATIVSTADTEAKRIISSAEAEAEIILSNVKEILINADKKVADDLGECNKKIDALNLQAANIVSDARIAAAKLNDESRQSVNRITDKVIAAENDLEGLKKSYREKKIIYDDLKSAITIYQDSYDLQEMGFYDPHFDFDCSEKFIAEIKANREKQKSLLKDKTSSGAIYCPTEWTVGGSKREGQKMTTRGIDLTARAFNGACDAAISSCTFKNIALIEDRIKKTFEKINKLNEVNQIYITPKFLSIKLEELNLTYEFKEKKQLEKEEQRELRAQIAEEKRAQIEIEKAIREAEEEERRTTAALNKARKEMEAKLATATAAQAEKYNSKITDLEEALAEAKLKGERALSMAQQTKRGHVYIISNIGSFGEEIYKIGMTRRLDPQDRVDELGSASVPFLFDVHAMIKSDDAPALESALHQMFDKKRVNAINRRKEFFNVSLKDVKEAVYKLAGDSADFIETATAQHYYETIALRKQESSEKIAVAKQSGLKALEFTETL